MSINSLKRPAIDKKAGGSGPKMACLQARTSLMITFHVRHRRDEMYIGHGRLCVCLLCLSLDAFHHFCTEPDVTWGMAGCALHQHRLIGFRAVGAGVEVFPFALAWPILYTTACTTAQARNLYTKNQTNISSSQKILKNITHC